MSNLVFEVHNKNNFTPEEKEKFLKALEEATKIINSPEFKQRALNLKLEQALGYNSLEIYQKFMSGSDKFNTVSDKDIDVHITMFYSFRNTVGYTYPTTWFTWINRKFFSRFNEAEIAGNVVHEYMHNLGFGHNSPRDKNSVPYAYGYLVRDMIREAKVNPQPQPTPVVTEPIKQVPSIWSRIAGFFSRWF
jgi:hypothetical protein